MRKKLNECERRVSLTITINPLISDNITDVKNKSKYIESLIYRDLLKKEKINFDIYEL